MMAAKTSKRKLARRPTAAQEARAWVKRFPEAHAVPVIKSMLREHVEHRKEFVKLSNAVLEALKQIDALMQHPATVERGRSVAKVLNGLEMANDIARRFSLRAGISGERKPAR